VLRYNFDHVVLGEAQRPYLVWLFYGPLDYVQFLGLPLAAVTLALLWPRRTMDGGRWTADDGDDREDRDDHRSSLIADRSSIVYRPSSIVYSLTSRRNIYAWLFWLLVVGIDLAGRTKAEQGRLLIFLAPFALVAVYAAAGRGIIRRRGLTVLFLAQLAVMVVIGARWFVP